MTRYAVVEKSGWHQQGEQVRALSTHDTIGAAARAAKRAGKRYRVIECGNEVAGDALGRGWAVDSRATIDEAASGRAIEVSRGTLRPSNR